MKLLLSLLLVAVIGAGAAARVHRVPSYVPDSGDEWGNTLAPLNILVDRGNPGTFFHPALAYEATALAYAGAYGIARATGRLTADASPADLLVHDERWYTYAARGVSVAAACVALAAVGALATALWSPLAGLFAAALLAVLPLHAMYSLAVRVDSVALAMLLVACLQLSRLLAPRPQRDWDLAGLLIGLAASANYPGTLLGLWLIAAWRMQPASGRPRLWRPVAIAALVFFTTNPYVLVYPHSFLQHLAFLSGMSTSTHPGREAEGMWFYLDLLATGAPPFAAVSALGALAIALAGTRRERFVLSLPLAWLLLFSLAQSKFDRFVLPAVALGCVVAAGLPFVLARRLAAHPRLASVAAGGAGVALLAAIALLLPRILPIPLHPMLPRADAPLLRWLEAHAPPGSTVLVESGLIPLVDVANGHGRLAAAVRESIARVRPGLAQRYLPMAYVGGLVNATPATLDAEHVDFVVLSPRTVRYVKRECARLPEVCAFHDAVLTRGVFQYEPDEGIEPAWIYRVR